MATLLFATPSLHARLHFGDPAPVTPVRQLKTAWLTSEVSSGPRAIREDLIPPTNLRAADAGDERSVTISWFASISGVAENVIERQRDASGTWVSLGRLRLWGTQTTFRDTPGLGTFRYRIAAATNAGISEFSTWANVEVTRGWTVFTPSADTRIVYVSSSTGNDANTGLSEAMPKRTIAAGYAVLRNGYPDWLLLKAGDVWESGLPNLFKSGRSATERLVVSSYGESPQRPLLRTGTGGGGSRWGSGRTDYVAVMGLSFTPHLRTPSSDPPSGFTWLDSGRHILLEDCKFDGYSDNVRFDGYTGQIEDVVIRRCVIVNAWNASGGHSQGLYTNKVNRILIEDCLFDHNGWNESIPGAGASIFNHNMYINVSCSGVIIRGTVSARASSHGAQVRPGGKVSNSLFVENAIALLMGTGGVAGGGEDPVIPVVVHGLDNVIVGGRDIAVSIPRGFGIDILFASSGRIEGNIIKDVGLASLPRAISFEQQGAGNRNVTVLGNVIYNWPGSVRFIGSAAKLAGIEFENNAIHQASTTAAPLVEISDSSNLTAVTFRNNQFWAPAIAVGSIMRIGNSNYRFDSWATAVRDTGSIMAAPIVPNAAVSLQGYGAHIGVSGGTAELLARMAAQSRRNWNRNLTAPAVNAYFRTGMGVPEPAGTR